MPEPITVQEGAQIGRWRIVSHLGTGGRATTWRATDEAGTEVALKHLCLAAAADWKVVELFEREASALQALDHPAIPRFIEAFAGQDEHPTDFFLAQELVEGRSLEQLLDDGASWSEAELIDLARQTLEILDWLHKRAPPIIHRDLKPSNLLVRPDGRLAVIDFGAVQRQLTQRPEGGSTVVGTHGYMAPEQLMGRAIPASDLYGLGATLIHLASGQHPGDLPTDGLDLDFKDHTPLSTRVESWLATLVAPDPRARPETAQAALSALEASLAPPAQSPASPQALAPRELNRHRGMIAAAILITLVLTVGILLARTEGGSQGPDTQAVTSQSPDGEAKPREKVIVELPTTFDDNGYKEIQMTVRAAALRKTEPGFPMSSFEVSAIVTNSGESAIRELYGLVKMFSFRKQTTMRWSIVERVHAPLEPGESRYVRFAGFYVPNDAKRAEIIVQRAPVSVELEPSNLRQVPIRGLGVLPVSLWHRRTVAERPQCSQGNRCFDFELRGVTEAWSWIDLEPECVGPGAQRRRTRNDRTFVTSTRVLGFNAIEPGDRPTFRVFCPMDAESVSWRLKKSRRRGD